MVNSFNEDSNTAEVWKDIKGYEGSYQVSNIGRVKSLKRNFIDKIGRKRQIKEQILKPQTDHKGYLTVDLRNVNGKKKSYKIHRLVCGAFHDNPENKPCVNHIDENKTNNKASNLEWCTYKENINHGTAIARITKALSKAVGQYTRDGELIKVWQSTREVERQLGINHSTISKVALGKKKTAHGYVWKYMKEEKI